jgi:F-type H+-transporting ATPase subunit delta
MSATSQRYARAFAQAAHAANLDPANASQQLNDFASTLSGSSELLEVLSDPALPHPQKLHVIDALAQRIGMAKPVRNFVAVIVDHQRLHALPEILTDLRPLFDAETGLTEAEVTSAHPLSEEDRRALEDKIGQMTSTRVSATYNEDRSLLGGAVVRIGATVYDGSVKAQLERLKQRLIHA